MAEQKQQQEKMPSKQTVGFNLSTLFPVLMAVSKAMSADDTRPHLSGVSVRVNGDFYTVSATNGHMLATYTAKADVLLNGTEEQDPWEPDEFLIGRRSVEHLIQEMKLVKQHTNKLGFQHEVALFNHAKKTCELSISTVNLDLSHSGEFPQIRGVFGKKLPKKRLAVLGIAPKYLKIASAIFDIGSRAVGWSVSGMVMQSLGSDIHAPVLVTSPDLPQMRVLLMSVRLGDHALVPVKETGADPNMVTRSAVAG